MSHPHKITEYKKKVLAKDIEIYQCLQCKKWYSINVLSKENDTPKHKRPIHKPSV